MLHSLRKFTILAVGFILISGCTDATGPPVSSATPMTAAAPPPPPPGPMAAPEQTADAPSTAQPSNATVAPATSEAVVPATDGSDEFANAKALFDSHGCKRCHGLDPNAGPGDFAGGTPPGGPPPGGPGQGGPGGGPGGPPKGPNLAHVGANPEHSVDWIAEHIQNPKLHNPRSRMPSFADKMSDEEIQAIAQFLASLK